jgi:NDP-sugar pyrophosphorylase family protein
MLNIVIPMAGAGSRFSSAGYSLPKPLIPVNGVPMIQVVINNLRPAQNHRFIFICQNEHIKAYGLIDRLYEWSPGSIIIGIDGLTEGAACTVLKARDYINSEDPLMIANSDQYIDSNINDYLDRIKSRNLAGLIMTMKASDPKWSFVGLNDEEIVLRVVEKEVISDEATVGIYNFSQGSDFVRAAELMIQKNMRVNNEFYVAPVYNELISNGYRVGILNIGKEAEGMYGLGTPSDLDLFLTLPVHRKINMPLL